MAAAQRLWPLEESLSRAHSIADAPKRNDEAGRCRVITQLATQMTDMHVDQVVIADPGFVTNGFEKLTAA